MLGFSSLSIEIKNVLLIVVRRNLINEITRYFGIDRFRLVDIENNDAGRIAEEILTQINESKIRFQQYDWGLK